MTKHHTKDLGNIQAGVRQTITFNIGKSLNIAKDAKGKLKIFSSCGCTSFSFNSDKTVITIRYNPKAVPKHLKGKYYLTAKTVTVYNTQDNREVSDVFLFTAKVYDKL